MIVPRDINKIGDGLGKGIDEKIKPLVQTLWDLGYETRQSCEGHTDHGEGYPWVAILDQPNLSNLEQAILEYNTTPPHSWILKKFELLLDNCVEYHLEPTIEEFIDRDTRLQIYPLSKNKYHTPKPLNEQQLNAVQQIIPSLAQYLTKYFKQHNISVNPLSKIEYTVDDKEMKKRREKNIQEKKTPKPQRNQKIKPLAQALLDCGYKPVGFIEGELDFGRSYPWIELHDQSTIARLNYLLIEYNQSHEQKWTIEEHKYSIEERKIVLVHELRPVTEMINYFDSYKPKTAEEAEEIAKEKTVHLIPKPLNQEQLEQAQNDIPSLAKYIEDNFPTTQ